MATLYIPHQNMSDKLWKNGSNEDSTHVRSRLVVSYSISDSYPSIVTADFYLQMARDNGDYGTEHTIRAYINDNDLGSDSFTISDNCPERGDKTAITKAIPESYFTTIGTLAAQKYTCNAEGSVSISYSVKATSSSNNTRLSYKSGTFNVSGGAYYSKEPTMNIVSQGGDYSSVWSTCNVTDWGQYGSTPYSSSNYTKIAVLTKNAGSVEVDRVAFNSNSEVKFNVKPSIIQPDYDIRFYLRGPYNIETIAYDANLTVFNSPSQPNSLTISCYDDEPTIASKYVVSWQESDWGSEPSGSIKGFRLQIFALDKYNVKYVIGYKDGKISNGIVREVYTISSNIYFDLESTSSQIEISTDSWSNVLSKFNIGDTIGISISSYVKYEEEVFLSSEKYSDNVIGPLQDDQAKVKLPWYESTSVSGKVWVKDNDTWKKAKKIYVDTGTASKNWQPAKN